MVIKLALAADLHLPNTGNVSVRIPIPVGTRGMVTADPEAQERGVQAKSAWYESGPLTIWLEVDTDLQRIGAEGSRYLPAGLVVGCLIEM